MAQAVAQLHTELELGAWQIPTTVPPPKRAVAPEDEGAPWWWKGAEEASQSFLREQGVVLD